MTWPWVSRRAYERAVEEANKMHALATSAMRLAREERERSHHLMDSLVQMRREGFVAPLPVPEPGPAPPSLPREVTQALDGLRLTGTLRARMEARARRELEDHTPGQVAAMLWQGGAVEEVEA